ncbi:peptide deformylase [Trichlorobacter ammonificans]|uniref:Peptide deformylase n=1 Tax=Trichlorobacter ammonificans TaxID=2916410 RepID=A0ABN8HBA4_9BACT|nr:peptide deformylase [Trichlorobacter ammonificans]CAH2029906.1 Peptide deformylase [Trichlorobacter ammonificans]
MAVQSILKYPHPLLKKLAHPVPRLDDEIRTLVQDLVDTMEAGPGSVGVAAPQIGVGLRVCVVDVSQSRHGRDNNHGRLLMVNPEIIEHAGSAVMREGCMSVPDYTGDVERATEITVRFLDGLTGEPREVRATGFEAVAIQHEMDHLDGVLFLDRVINVATGLFRRKNYR